MKLLSEKNLKPVIAIFFIITGATGLIYQVTWFKYLSLFVGNSTYAQMIVLSTFLGGLAIGNYVFGKKADKILNHVRVYGVLELFVGIYCLIYPVFNEFLGELFLNTAGEMNIDGQNLVFVILRFLFASSLLLLPTIAMGGTLPLISKFFIDKISNVRRELAILYFLNSFGAVWGIILSGFFLIKIIGLDNTIYFTAVINILIGLFAILLGIKKESITEIEEPEEEKEKYQISNSTLKIIIAIVGTSGMAALLYEIVWVRLLVNFLGSSTYAFSVMLLAFISGITSGSFIVASAFIKKYNKVKMIAFFQIAIALSTMVSLVLYERFPYILWNIAYVFNKTETSFGIFLTIEFLLCFTLLLLPTIFMGMTLPVIVDIVSGVDKKIGNSVGKVFSINTVGTVLGVLLASLILIPAFGIKGSFEIGIGINLLSAIVLILSYQKIKISDKIKTISFAAIVYVGFIFLLPEWNVNTLVKGVFRHLNKVPPQSFAEYGELIKSDSVLYYKEGVTANVAVLKSKKKDPQRRLVINGKADASSSGDLPTQVLLGQLPAMLHPNPQNAFIVGFGSGSTVGSILTHDVEKVTCVEMSNEVIEASVHFNDVNKNCLEDPRLNLVVEDALTYLKLSKEKYDVIISEPSNPWIAGIGNLFSKEYFNLCKSKLSEDGIMVQWFHLYELNNEISQMVISTFKHEFPEVQIWSSLHFDILLVGSKKKINFDTKLFEEKFSKPEIKSDLKNIGINDAFTLLSLQQLSNKSVFKLTNYHRLNSEKHPLLEFMAPKSFYISQTSNLVQTHDEKYSKFENELLLKEYLKDNEIKTEQAENAAYYHIGKTLNNKFAYSLTKKMIEENKSSYEIERLNYIARKNLGMQFPSEKLGEIVESYEDSLFVKKEIMNNQIRETMLASSFLKMYPIKKYVKKYIETLTDSDDKSKANAFENMIDLLYRNNELTMADSLSQEMKKMFQVNSELSSEINLKRYLFNSCRLSLHFNRDMDFLADFKAIGDFYPQDEMLVKLKKYFLLSQKKRNSAKENKENGKN
ncbi:MAG: fused MFS/spermidine synthase [Rhodothermaceae bacterium]